MSVGCASDSAGSGPKNGDDRPAKGSRLISETALWLFVVYMKNYHTTMGNFSSGHYGSGGARKLEQLDANREGLAPCKEDIAQEIDYKNV